MGVSSHRLCRVAVKPTSLDISRHQRLSPLVEQGWRLLLRPALPYVSNTSPVHLCAYVVLWDL